MSETDRAMLQFDWQDVEGDAITGIIGRSERALDDGAICWTAIALVVGEQAIFINVDPDTDELSVSLGSVPTDGDWAPIKPLAHDIGKALGWCWIGRNYRGYLDSFTVAFAGIDPECMFIGMAATIMIKSLAAPGTAQSAAAPL